MPRDSKPHRASRGSSAPTSTGVYPLGADHGSGPAESARTSLDWTILGPGQLTLDEPTGRIEYGDHVEEGATSRGNVAEVIAGVVGRSDLGGLVIRFRDGTVTVAEAMDSLARR